MRGLLDNLADLARQPCWVIAGEVLGALSLIVLPWAALVIGYALGFE